MNTHDIELPPLPVPRTKTDGGIELFAEYSVREYARAAIEPYKQRISELEAQLEAIEHAETRMNRAGRSDSEIELPALPEAEIDDAGAFMSDAQVMSIDSAKEYARVAVEHDRQQRSFTKPSTNQDWLSLDPAVAFHLIERHAENWNDAGAMMQAYLDAHIEADRKRRGESVTCFKCGHAKHGGECVNVAPQPASYCTMGKHACSDPSQCWEPCGELGKSSEHAKVAEPVKVHSDAETTARVGAWLSAALCDPAVCQEMKDDIWAWMKSGQPNVQPAATAQEPGVPECPCPCGWENLHKLAVHDGAYLARTLEVGQILTDNQRDTAIVASIRLIEVCRAMLAAAPKFGEEE